jgi:hypothetical protein
MTVLVMLNVPLAKTEVFADYIATQKLFHLDGRKIHLKEMLIQPLQVQVDGSLQNVT